MPAITEFDVIFLSYDEPNAEENYADLLNIAPWAKRVHGIKGFDAAHKAAANLSETSHFITVDADNRVRPEFFNLMLPEAEKPGCISWSARNVLNGLRYGNGGLKLWSKDYVLALASHETDDGNAAVDFCWSPGYTHDSRVFSDVYCTSTPEQAFRSGFREGVKLSLDRGRRVSPEHMKTTLHPFNLHNLRVWCTIGEDVENGEYGIYGARLGFLHMLDPDWDHTRVRDYEWFSDFIPGALENKDIRQELVIIADQITKTTGVCLPKINAEASRFLKECLEHIRP